MFIKNRMHGVGHVMQAILAEIVSPPLEPSIGPDGAWKLFETVYDLVETPPEPPNERICVEAASMGRPWVRAHDASARSVGR